MKITIENMKMLVPTHPPTPKGESCPRIPLIPRKEIRPQAFAYALCLIGLFFIVGTTEITAQDVHLSQFFHNNLNLNPANTGDFDGDFRLTGNYRNQWREISVPYVTTMGSFEKKFFYFTHEIDAGILLINDQFSGFNLSTNKILLSGAYSRLFGSNLLRIGVQSGIVYKRTDFNNQTFPNQWLYEQGEFVQAISNMEDNLGTNALYPDVNLGLSWGRQFSPALTTKIGFAINHLNKPKDGFHENEERLPWRYVAHAGLNWSSGKIHLEPKILYMTTTKTTDFIAGSKVGFNFSKKHKTQLYAGAFLRTAFTNHDAIIGLLGMQYNQFNVGLSYDYNISGLSDNTSNKSSFEIAVIYTGENSVPEKLSIPCERY